MFLFPSRRFLIPLLSFVLLACSEQPEPASTSVEQQAVNPTESAPDSLATAESAFTLYPRLSNENCESFLLEYGKEHPQNKVRISTSMGDIEVELFDDTPLHRANFIYLINRGYYSPTEFLRVVKGFVVQGGNSEEAEPQEKRFLIGEYTLPAEFRTTHTHVKGALAMSRNYVGNPEKRSSAYDFYIVHGRKLADIEIYEARQKRSYSDTQLQEYRKIGGAIHLDEEHTVFGRVVKGLDVVDKIAQVEVDEGNWPKLTIHVSMEIID